MSKVLKSAMTVIYAVLYAVGCLLAVETGNQAIIAIIAMQIACIGSVYLIWRKGK